MLGTVQGVTIQRGWGDVTPLTLPDEDATTKAFNVFVKLSTF